MTTDADIRKTVREKYGEAALRVTTGGSSCCGSAPAAAENCCDPITSNLYDAAQAGQIPEEALLASLGCGNPTALATLNSSEVVLDLGSEAVGLPVSFASDTRSRSARFCITWAKRAGWGTGLTIELFRTK